MASKKHYVLVSITLGAIATASALLIAGTHLLTANKIVESEKQKIKEGIASIYGETAEILSEKEISSDDYKYVNYCYEIKDGGFAYRTSGSNMYGNISLIVGFNLNNEFMSMVVVNNEQTYASTLKNKYLNEVNAGTRDIDDVKCDATYGAKLVRDMIHEAQSANEQKVWKK